MNEQQIKKCVGDRIREERKIWGWSQEVLAEKLYDVIDTVNVGGTAISSYERGATMPSVPVLYALAEPVITEIADMSLPSAYKPNTTIINDAGAGMKVEYVADPKTYYDNKFAQLAASLLGG